MRYSGPIVISTLIQTLVSISALGENIAIIPDDIIIDISTKTEILRPSTLVANPGLEDNNVGTRCHRADIVASFFNVDVVRVSDTEWLMGVQDGPQFSGCGPLVGNAFGNGDQTYLYRSTTGPLGQYLPVSYSERAGTGEILCQDSKDSNIGMFLPGKVEECDLAEGYWGLGGILETSLTPDLLVSEETGEFEPVGTQNSFRAYIITMDRSGNETSTRQLLMDSESINKGIVKPHLFRVEATDDYFAFFFNFFDNDVSFSNAGRGYGYLKYTTFPTEFDVWVMDAVNNFVQLPADRQILSIGDILDSPGNPPGVVGPIGKISAAFENPGFPVDNYMMFYPVRRNGDGDSCEGALNGKESVLGYSTFMLNKVPAPQWAGWLSHGVFKYAPDPLHPDILVEYQFDGSDAITNIDVVPITPMSGYVFWAEAVTCTEPQHLDRSIYGAAYIANSQAFIFSDGFETGDCRGGRSVNLESSIAAYRFSTYRTFSRIVNDGDAYSQGESHGFY